MRTERIIRAEAHAKINWCLAVTGRDGRGYHLLDMLMQRIALYDTVYAAPAETLSLRVAGDAVAGPPERNLALRAAVKLREACGMRAGARLTLVKRIPQGAGLGGGSSDAAAVLKALCRLWDIRPAPDRLADIALSLGADVPFFLTAQAQRVGGVGERLTPVSLPESVPLVLFKLTPGLSTAEVYTESDRGPAEPVDAEGLLACLQRRDYAGARALTGNALYPAAVRLQPEMETAKRAVEASGALYTLMTGSGAVVYGVYGSDYQAQVAEVRLKLEYPGAYAAWTHTVR